MSVFICQKCGHIEFDNAPEKCPVCFSPNFSQNDNVFKESEEKSKEASPKHIPAITVKKECGFVPENDCLDVMVRIGETLHPMQEEHFIQFVDCYIDNKYVGRSYFTPGLNPATCFHLKEKGESVTIVESCNVHGYWMAKESIV